MLGERHAARVPPDTRGPTSNGGLRSRLMIVRFGLLLSCMTLVVAQGQPALRSERHAARVPPDTRGPTSNGGLRSRLMIVRFGLLLSCMTLVVAQGQPAL